MEHGQATPATGPPLGILLMAPTGALLFVAVTLTLSGLAGLPAVALPAAAMLGGMLLAWPSLREAAAQPHAVAKLLVLVVLQETAVLFGFVIAFLALAPDAPALTSSLPLWIVGGAGAVTLVAQAAMLRRGAVRAVASQEAFGRFLLAYAACELVVLGGFVAAFLQLPSATS